MICLVSCLFIYFYCIGNDHYIFIFKEILVLFTYKTLKESIKLSDHTDEFIVMVQDLLDQSHLLQYLATDVQTKHQAHTPGVTCPQAHHD